MSRATTPATAPSPGAALVRKLGTAAAVVLIAGGVVTQTATAMQRTDRDARVLPSSVKRVVLEGTSGDVSVQESATSRAEARPDARWSGQDNPVDVTTTADGEEARITAACQGWNPFLACSVDWRLTLPAGTDLVIETRSGDVDLTSMSGTTQVTTGSGDITIDAGQAPSLRLRASSGEVVIRNGRSPMVSVETSSGDITVDSLVPLTSLDARATSGDVTVEVPRDATPYAVEQRTRSGRPDNEVITDATSSRRVRQESTSGDLTLRYR